jgi:tyrosyl-tRNA synthetase
MTDFLAELRWRNLLHQVTAEDAFARHIATPGRIGYCGFDPTADSLTIGNLVPILLLRRWQMAGHVPVALVGGATGLVGDPSGKDAERQLRTREQIEANIAGQRPIFERLLDFDAGTSNRARLVNNIDWWGGMGFIDVLRDIGKHFSVNEMIRRDSVRTRLEGRDHGISFTEFSYMLLQGYDFLHLHREIGCTVQLAGSDQFGNIVSGIDLIRRAAHADRTDGGPPADADAAHDPDAFGLTTPLVTRADGQKIGKTADGAVWLTADRTSPYRFHQYWMNIPDADVGTMLRTFTFLERDAIEATLAEHAAAPHTRAAQRTLARAVTDLVHGETERTLAERAAEALFTGEVAGLEPAQLAAVAAELPSSERPRTSLDDGGTSLLELLPETTLAKSRREAREFLGSGAISVNGVRAEADAVITRDDLVGEGIVLLRRGRKHWHAIRFVAG